MKISIGFDGWLLLLGILLSENKQAGVVCVLCAAVHELGHLCAARTMKIKIREMKLGFGGASIYPENEMISYRQEFFLCVFGPIFNIIFAVLSLFTLYFLYIASPPSADEITVGIFSALNGTEWGIRPLLFLCVIVSLLQATENLLPVEGLDGSRMMVALLSRIGNVRIAEIAEKATTLISAIALWLCSVYLLLKTGSGIGVFIFAACIFTKLLKRERRQTI